MADRRGMPLRIAGKIGLGVSVIVLVGLVAMALIYRGLGQVAAAMQDLSETREPASAAAYEMEIQLHAIGVAVLRYLDTGDAELRQEFDTGDAQFERFRERYRRLATTAEERRLDEEVEQRYQRFKQSGLRLLAGRNDQERRYTNIAERFEEIDRIVEHRVRPAFPPPTLLGRIWGDWATTELVLKFEAEAAEIGLWLANYQRVPRPRYRARVFAKERDARRALQALRAMRLSADQQRALASLDRALGDTMRSIGELLAEEQSLRLRTREFVLLRAELDRLLDDEIQLLAAQALGAPPRVAKQAVREVLGRIPLLMLAFLTSAVAVTALLTRAVRRPVRMLVEGVGRVSQGDLSFRMVPTSRDELARLTGEFNSMVERLESTTVSTERLRESEARLQQVVGQLSREIEERVRAEHERTQLERSLVRARTMSAMGAVVAGVAHEVRNPLFGISSTLDAMEARYGSVESGRYLEVLREQVERLSRLMRELLEYGRPHTLDLSLGSVEDAIGEALRVVRHVRPGSDVRAVCDGAVGPSPIRMDRGRLVGALANLVENAIQHSPPGEAVMVTARPAPEEAGPWIEVAVSDRGPGIPQEDIQRIFEPFFTRRRGGTGLGLSIVQRIVEEHGGTVWAQNGPGGGAIVTVRLPAGGVPPPAEARPA